MPDRSTHFSLIYGLQRTIFTTLYIISSLAILTLILYILVELFKLNGFITFFAVIIYLVLTVILGSYLHVLSFIPVNLASSFDPIKDDVAQGNIKTPEEFSHRICRFITGFFSFTFFDIAHCLVHIKGQSITSTFDHNNTKYDDDYLGKRSRAAHEVTHAGRLNIGGVNHNQYLVPVWFGEEWLGFITVYTRQILRKPFRNLLSDLENNFIDDQLIHILKHEV
jgi:hypothetical protein